MSIWNPWHGCHKISPGCANCYVYRRDESIGKTRPLSPRQTITISQSKRTGRVRSNLLPMTALCSPA